MLQSYVELSWLHIPRVVVHVCLPAIENLKAAAQRVEEGHDRARIREVHQRERLAYHRNLAQAELERVFVEVQDAHLGLDAVHVALHVRNRCFAADEKGRRDVRAIARINVHELVLRAQNVGEDLVKTARQFRDVSREAEGR